MKKKWWVLAQPIYSPQGNERKFPGRNPSDRTLNAEDNPGRLGGQDGPRAHSRYIHVQQEWHDCGPYGPPTNKPKLPPPHIYIYIYIFFLINLFIYLFIYYTETCSRHHGVGTRHAKKKSSSKREANLKKEKKNIKISLLCPLSCKLGHKRTSYSCGKPQLWHLVNILFLVLLV